MASNISFLFLIVFTFATTVDVAQAFDHFKLISPNMDTDALPYKRGKCQVLTIPERFGIHGLWPENSNSSYERPSPKNPLYIKIPLDDLYHEILREWPDVENNPDDQVLWENEWDFHGTISANMYNQGQYFEQVVELVKGFPVRYWLSEVNIYANEGVPRYNAQNISWAIFAKTLKEPELRCEDNHGANELKEIILCVDLAGWVIDCPRPNKNCFEMPVSFLL